MAVLTRETTLPLRVGMLTTIRNRRGVVASVKHYDTKPTSISLQAAARQPWRRTLRGRRRATSAYGSVLAWGDQVGGRIN
jgi:hypothetical protein